MSQRLAIAWCVSCQMYHPDGMHIDVALGLLDPGVIEEARADALDDRTAGGPDAPTKEPTDA